MISSEGRISILWIDKYFEQAEMEEFWDGHRGRMRSRMEESSFKRLKFHEQLEVLLYPIMKQKDMSDLARNIADEFKDHAGFIEADPEAFEKIPGMTKCIFDWLMIIQEIIRAYLDLKRTYPPTINNLRNAIEYIKPLWRNVRPPESWIVYTDFEDKVIVRQTISPSLSWGEIEYVRQILMDCSAFHAKHAIIYLFVGTLPLEIGDYDRNHLIPISLIMHLIGVELVDIIMVGESGYLSFSRDPIMDVARADFEKKDIFSRYLMETPEDDSQWND